MSGKTDIGPKIGIEGEKQFRDEIKAINAGTKVFASQMRLLTSEFIGNEKSIEFLTKQNSLFESEVSSLNDKLKLQEKRLMTVTRAYKEGSVQSLEAARAAFTTRAEINELNSNIQKNTDLINAQISDLIRDADAFLEELNAVNAVTDATKQNTDALGDNVDALQSHSKAAEKNSGAANSLSGVFKSALSGGLQKLGGQLGLSSSQVSTLTSDFLDLSSSALGTVGPLGVTLTAVLKLASGLVKLAEAGGKHVDEINSLATAYNLSTKDVQRFQYMAELTDVSVDTMTGSISSLIRSMDSARTGSGDAASAFAQLGVSVTNGDGSLRSANEVFMETIDALRLVGNATERDALTMDIFGRSAQNLNGIINIGSKGLADYAAEADRSGYVMSDKMVAALQEADDATQRLSKAGEGLKNTLGGLVAPAVADVKNALADMTSMLTWYLSGEAGRAISDEFGPIIQSFLGLKEAADEATGAVEDNVKALASIRDSTPEDFWTEEQKAFKDYVKRASEWSAETGQTAIVYQPGAHYQTREEYLQERQSQPIDITLELDGKTLARATYDDFQAEANRRGPRAVY